MEVALSASLHPADVTQLMNRESLPELGQKGTGGGNAVKRQKEGEEKAREVIPTVANYVVISQLCLHVFHTLTSWVESGGSLRK